MLCSHISANIVMKWITEILESVFDWSGLGMFMVLHLFPDCTHNFFIKKSTLQNFIVQIWSCESQTIYFKRSHQLWFQLSSAHNDMFEVSHQQFTEGSDSVTVNMKGGGLWIHLSPIIKFKRLSFSRVILDPHLKFIVFKRFAVTFVFRVWKLINRWAKLWLPHSLKLERKVAEMVNSQKIGMNFTF